MRFVHPFTPIIETKTYPHARSYRTGFIEKIMDAFDVFSGGIPGHNGIINETDEDIYGIFDYLTIGLHFWLSKTLKHRCQRALSNLSMIGWGSLFILVSIPRYVFAAIMTLICLPIIGIIAIITKKKGDEIKQAILDYKIQDVSTSNMTLGKLLQERNCSLEDSEWSTPTVNEEERQVKISLISHNTQKPTLILSLFFNNPDDKKILESLQKLNIDNLQTRIEKPKQSEAQATKQEPASLRL